MQIGFIPFADRTTAWEKSYRNLYTVKCATCGQEFKTENPKKNFCSNLCLRRQRKGSRSLK